MPPRRNPTARQVRLGAELRRLRESAALVSRDVAAWLGTNQAQISNIESGKHGISEERLRKLTAHYDVNDPQLVAGLVGMANDRIWGWWEEYRGALPPKALDIAELEHHASYVRVFEVVHIPGVLQTEDHVRAASLFVNPDLSEAKREAHVSFRVRRQGVLTSAKPYDVIIHESALRMHVGGPKVARAQLEHLLHAADRETVTLRVIPFAADGFAGAGFPMQYLGGVVPRLDTVQADGPQGPVFIDAPPQLDRCRSRLERAAGAALAQDASLDLIRCIAQEL
ncbi:helix-turn-helix domain-containing protein [Streptomyces tailanensis]|uniref:helix-turn-helix domain-containing protein n=1 Tax=Streptomyces tailanensis TaxID=2569858 RepID=UPI00122E7243|nr:helix-turn-helix transcriptional regulator [Streptomyces tailanensis]